MDVKTNDPLHEELAALADQYQHTVQSPSVLEPYKEPVLLLRAKYASYEQIADMLTQRGIQISTATVRRFCRTHHTEMKRLRHDIDESKRKTVAAPNAADAVPSANSPEPQRPSLTADAGQHSPRIARDDL